MVQLLESDLLASLAKDFGNAKQLDQLDRELLEHTGFADMRRRVYVGGEEYFNELDTYLFTPPPDHTFFLVTGDAGCGKSSLFANWQQRCLTKAKANQLKCISVSGATIDWNNAVWIVRHIGSTINSRYPY